MMGFRLGILLAGILLGGIPTGTASAGSDEHGDASKIKILKNLAGCFGVSYRFVENGVHDKDLKGDLFEEIVLEEKNGVYAFQHWGIFKGARIRHWREEWRKEPDGRYTQRVIGPFEDFRYECTAPFVFNQWHCAVTGAPKPNRDRERTDYEVLDRTNTLQITPPGWVHAERNVKRARGGTAVANEVGWNEYRRVEASRCEERS